MERKSGGIGKSGQGVLYPFVHQRSMCNVSNFPNLPHLDRNWLNLPISDQEIYDAISHMGAFKALGPDGFSPCFFQKCWHIVGPKVREIVQYMFRMGKLVLEINEVLICIIPKGDTLEFLNQFRHISLCNVLVKVVTKILVNRLKPLMTKLVWQTRASFIPGRSMIDNIIVAQELVHSLKKKKGRKGVFILKVDLEKVYDRVEWSFLQQVLVVTEALL